MSSIVLPYWFDRPASEAIEIARNAERFGFGELWIGEMATFDAFALAGAIARETNHIQLTIGPLPVATRSPVALAMGTASIAELSGRSVGLALGASNPMIVSGWHERDWLEPTVRMREQIQVLRRLLAGERVDFHGRRTSVDNFKLRLTPPPVAISVAAFAPQMLRLAATAADRVVVNLLTPSQVARVRTTIDAAAAAAHAPRPTLVAWVPAALAIGDATHAQLAQQIAAYLAAPGYGEMFAEAGFAALVERARGGERRLILAQAVPRDLLDAVAAIGDPEQVRTKLDAWRDAGADVVAIVPSTAEDPAAENLLRALCAS